MAGKEDKGMTVLPRAEKAMSIREAMLGQSEVVTAEKCAGRILADTAVSCPPAVPIYVCGERIPEGGAEILARYGIDKVSVIKE